MDKWLFKCNLLDILKIIAWNKKFLNVFIIINFASIGGSIYVYINIFINAENSTTVLLQI